MVRYYGYYSNKSRGLCTKAGKDTKGCRAYGFKKTYSALTGPLRLKMPKKRYDL